MYAFVFNIAYRSRSMFKFEFNSNGFEIIKNKRFPIPYIALGRNPSHWPSQPDPVSPLHGPIVLLPA
jgi:hypothetical protein